jgi:NADH-quinone oxidoreductase subunit L
MGRIIFVAFLGKARSEHVEHATESRFDMVAALVLLSVGAALAGYTGLYPVVLGEYLHANVLHPVGVEHEMMLALSAGLSLGGLLVAFLLYYRPGRKQDTLQRNVPGLFWLIRSKLFFDEIYRYYVNKVQQRFAAFVAFLELVFIQGALVRGSGGVSGLIGIAMRRAHTGSLNAYLYWFAAGVLIFWLYSSGVL